MDNSYKKCKTCGTIKTLEFFRKVGKWYLRECLDCLNAKRRTGKINETRFKKGQPSWNKGKKFPYLPRKRSSLNRGSATHFEWIEKVKQRDGYRCTHCSSEKNLHAHHIKKWREFPDLCFEIDNGQTLCATCHAKLHETVKGGWNKGVPCKYKGIPRTQEVKEKLRQVWREKKEIVFTEPQLKYHQRSGNYRSTTGIKFSEERKKNISLSLRGRPAWNKGKYEVAKISKPCKVCLIEKKIEEFTPLEKGKYRANKCKVCRNKKLKNAS